MSRLSERRRPFAYNSTRMVQAKMAVSSFKSCSKFYTLIQPIQSRRVERMKKYLKVRMTELCAQYIAARFVDSEELDAIVRRPRQHNRNRINDLVDVTLLTAQYRFRNQNQLHRLLACFQLPEWISVSDGSLFHREEALLIFLKIVMFPNQMSVVSSQFHRNSSAPVSRIVLWMYSFFIREWGYLITNNMRYWTPLLPKCAEAIRNKIQSTTGEHVVSISESVENGFRTAVMLDFTAVYTCAPGTGPQNPGGPGAPRADPAGLQQEAAYSGYYAHHGLKVLSASLPNGMDYHVFFPVLLPKSETNVLTDSQLLEISSEAQEELLHLPFKYRFHADSNFVLFNHDMLTAGGLASIRVYEEHTYKDLKMICKSLGYRQTLQLNVSSVAAKVLVACILRNAYNCINYGQVSVFFSMGPPTLEHWTSQGPHAFPLKNPLVNPIDFALEGL